jgi:hypothetical protein
MEADIVDARPSEAPTDEQQSYLLFALSARSLVKRPLKGGEASDRITSGSPL